MAKKNWIKDFKEWYPRLLGKGGTLICEYTKNKKLWKCELSNKKFDAKLVRLGTERPLMASSLFIDEYGGLAMGGLGGSKIECRHTGKGKNTHYREVFCVLRGI